MASPRPPTSGTSCRRAICSSSSSWAESSREIGAFPQRDDCVELLVMDKALYDQLQDASARLVGRVVKVFPARDASLVDVVYPSPAPPESATAHSDGLGGVRRVSVAHGYLRVIDEASFLARAGGAPTPTATP
ncbi:hypothetical protein PINS_up022593 [Pythium insidiosum]|nr:hypothetical protein PINS_up022593 [Pythium insidiosum]